MTKNKWYDILLFLVAWFTLFHPGGVASFFNVDASMKYYFFPAGIFIYASVISLQKMRITATRRAESRAKGSDKVRSYTGAPGGG